MSKSSMSPRPYQLGQRQPSKRPEPILLARPANCLWKIPAMLDSLSTLLRARKTPLTARGTFSKLLFPGLRLGILVAGQEVESAQGQITSLTGELSKVKSFTIASAGNTAAAFARTCSQNG